MSYTGPREIRQTIEGFYVAFNPCAGDVIPEGKIEGTKSQLFPGQSLTCAPIVVNGKTYSVLHVRTASTRD